MSSLRLLLTGIESQLSLPIITSIFRHDLGTTITNNLKLVYSLDIGNPETGVTGRVRLRQR